jgi:hypothetical protein
LKDSQGNQDRFIVVPPAFAPVLAPQPRMSADLLSMLQRLAAQKAPLEQQVTPP